jgi:hypothetical protein
VLGPADAGSVAAIEDDHHLTRGDGAQPLGELAAGQARGGERSVGGVIGIDRQQVLAGVGAGGDAPAVAGVVDEGGGLPAAAGRQLGQRRAQRRAGGRFIGEQPHVARWIAAALGVGVLRSDVAGVIDRRQRVEVLVGGNARHQRVRVLQPRHAGISSIVAPSDGRARCNSDSPRL